MMDVIRKVDQLRRRPKLQDPMLGLIEEVGEVGQALNVERHGKNKKLKETTAEECVDVILCTWELFLDEGGTIESFLEHAKYKLDRWERRLDKKGD